MTKRKEERDSYEYDDEWGRDEYKTSKKKQKPRQANTFQPNTRGAYKSGKYNVKDSDYDDY